jgi:hypothetical protein
LSAPTTGADLISKATATKDKLVVPMPRLFPPTNRIKRGMEMRFIGLS